MGRRERASREKVRKDGRGIGGEEKEEVEAEWRLDGRKEDWSVGKRKLRGTGYRRGRQDER